MTLDRTAPNYIDQAESAASLRAARTIAWLKAGGLLYHECEIPAFAVLPDEFLDRLSFASHLIVEQRKPGQIVIVKVRA